MEFFNSILSHIWIIVSSALVGGGIWKGLEAVSGALSKRAEAIAVAKRLEIDRDSENYSHAIKLIEALENRVGALERRNDTLKAELDNKAIQWSQAEMIYIEKIRTLENELSDVKEENIKLRERIRCLEGEYKNALERIDKLEKGDTGPLRHG